MYSLWTTSINGNVLGFFYFPSSKGSINRVNIIRFAYLSVLVRAYDLVPLLLLVVFRVYGVPCTMFGSLSALVIAKHRSRRVRLFDLFLTHVAGTLWPAFRFQLLSLFIRLPGRRLSVLYGTLWPYQSEVLWAPALISSSSDCTGLPFRSVLFYFANCCYCAKQTTRWGNILPLDNAQKPSGVDRIVIKP